jgi:hypothetical protein
MPPAPSRISIPDGVLVREMQGESVLLDLATETYFGLDDVGSRMWVALTTTPSIDSACDLLVAEYDVDRERLDADLRAFTQKLIDAGLLRVSDE